MMPAEAGPALATCPKCGAPPVADATACTKCGLQVERWTAFAVARDAAVPDAVRDAWTRATEAWDDPARHDELMRLVAMNNCYAWAAGRYRTREDDVGQRQLARLRKAAEATMMATATVRDRKEPTPYRATLAILAMMIIAIVAGLLYALIHDGGEPAAKTPLPAHRGPAPAPSPR